MAEKKRFLLRLDRHLYAALERWAADELRSVNAHIEYLLRQAARKAGRLPAEPKEQGQEESDPTRRTSPLHPT